MNYPNEILVKDYFEIHNYYENIYGKSRTIILMQVGSFHEAYCTDDLGLNLVNLAEQLDVHCTKKNSNNPMSKTNPRMMGFPIHVTGNFIDKLIDLNYTVVLIDQVSEPPFPIRKVTGIYSPATHIEKKSSNSLYLVSIVLDKIKSTQNNSGQLCIGLSAYDLATGVGYVFETYSKPNDVLLGLDDAHRFLENFPPREIVLENNLADDETIANMNSKSILAYLNIEPSNTYKINICQHVKIKWQRTLFERVYKSSTNIDIIETLSLQCLNWARLSLVLLLDYVINHQPNLIEHLRIPHLFSSNKYLYLGNRALEQLDVTPNKDISLFNVINFTKTAIGKRFLYSQLAMPLLDPTELNTRYNTIEVILKKNHQNNLVNYLENIYDLDKLIRKLEINIINPNELYQLYISFYQVTKLIDYLKTNKLSKIFGIDDDLIKLTNEFIKWIEIKFKLDKINGLVFNNFTETDISFYNKSIYNEIDQLQDSIDSAQNFMKYLVESLESQIDDKVYFNKKNKDANNTETDVRSLITLKYNDRDGHYLLMTNRRCDLLKQNFTKNNINILNVGTIKLYVKDLIFDPLPKSSNTKITCAKVKELSVDLVNYKISMCKKLKEYFKLDIQKIFKSYDDVFHTWTKKLAYIDFINSGAICVRTNHYTKPIINVKPASYFKATQMRHPIIENINTGVLYVPHDIELGYETKQNGILLYGINSSGKSTLMKSIGLNIILAQIGYYTATDNFEFSPYSSLFTRISGNDNMFKGLSSFMVEMVELMAILKRNDNKTMMIGDEICRGTEEKSANIIVCYMLETLSNSKSSFITATHLHRVANLDSVKQLTNVKPFHLKVTYNPNDETIIYDRHLTPGQGESFYGLQVAKFLMKDKKFNERTNEILKEYDSITTEKTSKYNSDIYVSECEICKSTTHLETHHIVWQKEFDENLVNINKLCLLKNNKSNLVVLCQYCHDMVDRNEIIINGWLDTSNGRKLDWIKQSVIIKNTKHSDELIKYIKKLKSETTDPKFAQIKIKETFNKKITTKSILTYWGKIEQSNN